MECPECGSHATRVYATKPNGQLKQRYRACRMCGHRFVTWEEPEKRDLRAYRRGGGAGETPDLFAPKNRKDAG